MKKLHMWQDSPALTKVVHVTCLPSADSSLEWGCPSRSLLEADRNICPRSLVWVRRQFSIIADGRTVKVWEVKNWLRNLRLVLRPYVAQPNNVSGWIFAPNENSLEAEHSISAEQSPNHTCSSEARHNRHPESHSCIWKNNPWCITCTAQEPLRLNFIGNWRELCWTPEQLKMEVLQNISKFFNEILWNF